LQAVAQKIIEASAIDAYPKEAVGLLLGLEAIVGAAYNMTSVKDRSRYGVQTLTEIEHRLHEHFGSAIIGEFHSHPEDTPAASPEDRKEMVHNDTPYLGDGSFMLIAAVWPGKRKPWRFKWQAYQVVGEKVVRVRLLT
jgi:proteasome lid subunit RPN8/RPN11